MPMATQKWFQATPAAISGPTTNWPAEPPAMPNICVAPISVAAREAGKFVRGDVGGAHQREDAARALQEAPTLASARLPEANSSAPMPTAAAPIGTTRRGPSRSIATPATRLNGE